MPVTVNRRKFMARSGAFVSTLAVCRHAALGASKTPFALGVAAGEPTSDSLLLWTRLAYEPLAPDGRGGMSSPVPVKWEVATDEALSSVVQSGTIEADARFAHSVHAEVRGLEPGRPYWYRFTALGAQSPVGRARTAPASASSLERLRFAFAACSHYELGYFSAYRHIAEESPDLVLFLGDYIYEEAVPEAHRDLTVRKHDGPTAADLVGYRNRYALYRMDQDLQALHASTACLMTWDDHEFANDYADEWSQDMRVGREDFLRRRAAAYQAYYEHMPLRARAVPRGASLRLHERFRFGDLVTFAVLDGRQFRSKQPCEVPPSRRGHVAPPTCTERTDAARSLLGEAQERWLFDGFSKSDTIWNVLAQGQLMAQLRQATPAGELGFWTDGWDGYPATRSRLLDAMAATKLSNPVVIGGDIHSFWVTDLKSDFNNQASATRATEFVCTSVTSNPPPHEAIARLLPNSPHVKLFESRYRGYVSADLYRNRLEVSLQTISDRRDRNATVSTLKRFVTENGQAGAIPG